jgi:hypothetical protein
VRGIGNKLTPNPNLLSSRQGIAMPRDPQAQAELERLLRERDQLKQKYYDLAHQARQVAKELTINKRRIEELRRA